jgi:hypothetical protein
MQNVRSAFPRAGVPLFDRLRLEPLRAIGCQRDRKGAHELANRLGSASALPDGKEIPGCTSVDDWPNHHFRCRKLPHVVRHDRDGMLTHHKRHVLARLSPQRTKRGLNLARRQSFATQRFRPGTACSAAPINTSLRNSLILTRLRLASR